ncbi:MAG: DUF493 domain-containing protein [Gammaproteobacteria bacterium]
MSDEQTLLEFPCDFPVKVVGRSTPEFEALVKQIVERHAGPVDPEHIRGRPSRDGNFVALTCLIRAQNQAQLDALYQELSDNPDVLMAL